MSYFDDVKVFLGKGMDAADRKTQELRLQADLNRINANLESAYAALGKVVYSHPTLAAQVQEDCPGECNGISSLLKEEQDVRTEMDNLRRQATSTADSTSKQAQYPCPKCGSLVTLDLKYCQNCGDNLAELKAQYRMCPTCGTYYATDSSFCMQCGARTVELPVAPALQPSASNEEPEKSDSDESVAETLQEQNVQPSEVEVVASETSESEESSEEPTIDVESSTDVVETEAPSAADIVEPAPQQTEEESASVESDHTLATPVCPSCGSAVEVGDAFCGECGAKLAN